MIDFALRGNKILTPTGMRQAVVLVKDGLIADVLPELPAGFDGQVIDL